MCDIVYFNIFAEFYTNYFIIYKLDENIHFKIDSIKNIRSTQKEHDQADIYMYVTIELIMRTTNSLH